MCTYPEGQDGEAMTRAPAVETKSPQASQAPLAAIKVENIALKRYGTFEAVKGVNFEVAEGEIIRAARAQRGGEEHAHPQH